YIRAARTGDGQGVGPGPAAITDGVAAIAKVVDHAITAVAAVDRVITGTARQRVATGITVERIVAGITVERVVAGATMHDIVLRAGADGIVATLAVDDVDAAIEEDGVVTLGGNDVLDRGKDVDARCGEGSDGTGRRDGGTCGACREVDGVDPTGVA